MKRKHARRRGRWVAALVAAFVVAVVAFPVGYILHLENRVEANLRHADLLPVRAESSSRAHLAATPDAQPLNVLIVGNDSRGSDVGRSDVILIAHLSGDRQRVDLVHVPRDLYVAIPGHGKSKINASYAWGGVPLLVQTIEQHYGIHIDHAALTGFTGFAAAMDIVGGVDITVEEASPGFAVGPTHLDGEAALRYVRERKHLSQGDISRGERQLQVMAAVMRKGLSRDVLSNPETFARFLEAGTAQTTVDAALDKGAIRSLVLSMRDLRADGVHRWTAPWRGVGMVGSASVVWSAETQAKKLGAALERDAMASYSDPISPRQGWGG